MDRKSSKGWTQTDWQGFIDIEPGPVPDGYLSIPSERFFYEPLVHKWIEKQIAERTDRKVTRVAIYKTVIECVSDHKIGEPDADN
jgi:hypothetical protein